MRIHVTGNAASGKTTLATQIGNVLGLPVYSIDSLIWLPGWRQPPREERTAAIRELALQPAWVIDGVAGVVRERADVVIFLDTPASICAVRGLRRCARYFTASRPGFPEDCPEWKIAPLLMRIIFSFSRRAGVEIVKDLQREPERYRVVAWPRSAEPVLRELVTLSQHA